MLKLLSQITFLYFADLNNAVDFFENKLGFERVCDQGYCVMWKTGKSSFLGAVDKSKNSMDCSSKGSVLTCFVVDDVEKIYDSFKAEGFRLLTEIRRNKDRGVHSFLFEGPENYRFEVQEFKNDIEKECFSGI